MTPEPAGGAKPQTLTTDDFDRFVKEGGAAVVDFWAPWCGPCRVVGPIIDELARELEGKVRFGKLNVDDHPEKSAEYGVSGIPTMWLFRDGKPLGYLVGAMPKDALRATLLQHLTATEEAAGAG